jgi:hypothetical protein
MTLFRPLITQPSTGTYTYTAAEWRSLINAIVPVDGVTLKTDLQVTQRGAGANMTVDVAAGQCAVTGTSVANQGTYICVADTLTNVAVAAAPGSGTRIDLVVAHVLDDQNDGSGFAQWTPQVCTGTVGAGVPTVPNTFFQTSLALAQITVAAGTASITNAMIKDVRVLNTLGDVPLWELTGGNGLAVPTNTATTFSGWTFSDLIGVDTNSTPGEIVIRQPGRYTVSYTHRLDTGGTVTAARHCWMEQVRSGTVIRRIGAQEAFPADVDATHGLAQTATGPARCQAGDVLYAKSYHKSGVTLHLDDINKDLSFSGWRVGP